MSASPRNPIVVLREIQQGTLAPKLLAAPERRACVELMTGEGYSMPEIAHLLQISVRTAQRDLALVREAHAVTASPEFTHQFVGQLLLHVQQGVARLRKISRDRATPANTQVEAETSSWKLLHELTQALQRLGILPTAALELRADVRHHALEDLSPEEMQKQIIDIEQILGPDHGSPSLRKGIKALKGHLATKPSGTRKKRQVKKGSKNAAA